MAHSMALNNRSAFSHVRTSKAAASLGLRRALATSARTQRAPTALSATMKALIFDCDGVILESEDLHRRAYNAAFQEFKVTCPNVPGAPVDWTVDFYDILQNKVGGGKPKMRWYFNEHGWPKSTVLPMSGAPKNTEEEGKLIDTLQDFKSLKYQEMLGSGQIPPRSGVLRLMDEAKAAGLKVAVCSAATKASCVFTVQCLLGADRIAGLDCFLAGDDVAKLKPDPTIYRTAAGILGVLPEECVVVEDSLVGLRAALAAGMRCVITYTHSTRSQEFPGAERIVGELGDAPANLTVAELMEGIKVMDDRLAVTV